jgi:hypothetical protein
MADGGELARRVLNGNKLRALVSTCTRCAMKLLVSPLVFFLLVAGARSQERQTSQDEVLQITREWLKAISAGDRVTLNRIMDPQCLVTTPGGDILSKERLVPNDDSQSVQTLPSMELSGPIVRVYANTAVLMTHLRPTGEGQEWISTFIYNKEGSTWRIVGLHGTARK